MTSAPVLERDHVIRAWCDPAYRETLTAEEVALLPAHPAGTNILDSSKPSRMAMTFGTTDCCTYQLGCVNTRHC